MKEYPLMPAEAARNPRPLRSLHSGSGRAPTAQRMKFGGSLRKHRESLGLKEADVARQLNGCSASKVSRMERGEHDFREGDVLRLLDIYEITDAAERDRLLGLCRDANAKQWWESYRDVAPKELQTYVSLEDIAERIRSYESGQLLGLLQTEDYTRALIRANTPGASEQEIERIIEFRAMRARRFLEESDAQLICVLDEITLSRGYGSRQTMHQQLDRLVELSDHERIAFRLIPNQGSDIPVQIGTSTIFDFAGEQLPTIVYVEGCDGGLYHQDTRRVDSYVKGFDRLQIAAQSRAACRRKLVDYVDHYRR